MKIEETTMTHQARLYIIGKLTSNFNSAYGVRVTIFSFRTVTYSFDFKPDFLDEDSINLPQCVNVWLRNWRRWSRQKISDLVDVSR